MGAYREEDQLDVDFPQCIFMSDMFLFKYKLYHIAPNTYPLFPFGANLYIHFMKEKLCDLGIVTCDLTSIGPVRPG